MKNTPSTNKEKIVKAWAVVRKSDYVLFDDSCGDNDPIYPIFKTRHSAVIYKQQTYGRSHDCALIVQCEIKLIKSS